MHTFNCCKTVTQVLMVLVCWTAQAQQTCRTGSNKLPHQNALWQNAFPTDESVEALCDGSVTIDASTGEICVTGRVSYDQLSERVGKPIRAPAAGSISTTGHFVSGSPNVVLGAEAAYLYDFVTKYTVGGTTYMAGPDITDKVFAASRGLVTEVCYDSSFAQEEAVYDISHNFWLPRFANQEKYKDANIIFAGPYSVVAEYHTPSDAKPFLGTVTNTIITFIADIVPGIVTNFLPLLGATGIFRFFIFGAASTAQWPQPLTAPPTDVEDIQIDTEWSTLMAAMADGLFNGNVPLYFGVLIKRLSASSASNGCWKTETAAMDIQAPKGEGEALDRYIREEVLPMLKKQGGSITLHMGKRLDNESDVLEAALETYAACGVEMDLSPDPCYHPACNRSPTVSSFTYPEDLYQQASGSTSSIFRF